MDGKWIRRNTPASLHKLTGGEVTCKQALALTNNTLCRVFFGLLFVQILRKEIIAEHKNCRHQARKTSSNEQHGGFISWPKKKSDGLSNEKTELESGIFQAVQVADSIQRFPHHRNFG
eukprot:TRINITY_DN19254_c0_g1_i1.p4 TRINITY_DN19254_c0_g1~~TRINITY_DN19254_c0_g1_i1.p4  ORF type:complete len:118 (-),score=11.26 TRINITY_DN19254_c0_g1_i1:883-1236(-)